MATKGLLLTPQQEELKSFGFKLFVTYQLVTWTCFEAYLHTKKSADVSPSQRDRLLLCCLYYSDTQWVSSVKRHTPTSLSATSVLQTHRWHQLCGTNLKSLLLSSMCWSGPSRLWRHLTRWNYHLWTAYTPKYSWINICYNLELRAECFYLIPWSAMEGETLNIWA